MADASTATDSEDAFPIQLMSDLHLEFPFRKSGGRLAFGYEVFDIKPAAPTLALLGDIGVTVNDGLFMFLEKQLMKFERVLYVMGNHEGYKSTYEKSRARFREFAASMESQRASGSKIGMGTFHFLDRTRVDLSPSVTVLGSTLWSHVPPESSDAVFAGLNDFMQVKDWTVQQYNEAHNGDVEWLAEEIARLEIEPGRRVVIITHHAPAFDGTSDPRHKGSPISPGFATEMPLRKEIWNSQTVKAWAFGHTHYNCDFVKDGIRIVANQRGYEFSNESKKGGFRGDFVLHV